MAATYLATDERAFNRYVVIKVPDSLRTVEARERFVHEARRMIGLHHSHIVTALDVGSIDTPADSIPFIVMTYMEGGDLAHRLSASGGVQSAEEVLAWLAPIAGALDFVHRKGLLHRDVKPGNILFDAVGDEGQAFLADFGISRVLVGEALRLTRTGDRLGSPQYMAPERWFGQVDARYDQYSLACVAYEALSGTLPHSADDPLGLAMEKASKPPRRILDVAPQIPSGAAAAVMRALEREPSARFESCGDFAAAFASGLGVQKSKVDDVRRAAALQRERFIPENPEVEVSIDPPPVRDTHRLTSPFARLASLFALCFLWIVTGPAVAEWSFQHLESGQDSLISSLAGSALGVLSAVMLPWIANRTLSRERRLAWTFAAVVGAYLAVSTSDHQFEDHGRLAFLAGGLVALATAMPWRRLRRSKSLVTGSVAAGVLFLAGVPLPLIGSMLPDHGHFSGFFSAIAVTIIGIAGYDALRDDGSPMIALCVPGILYGGWCAAPLWSWYLSDFLDTGRVAVAGIVIGAVTGALWPLTLQSRLTPGQRTLWILAGVACGVLVIAVEASLGFPWLLSFCVDVTVLLMAAPRWLLSANPELARTFGFLDGRLRILLGGGALAVIALMPVAPSGLAHALQGAILAAMALLGCALGWDALTTGNDSAARGAISAPIVAGLVSAVAYGGIVGTVRDPTGTVLPGVTVTAGRCVAVSNGDGNFRLTPFCLGLPTGLLGTTDVRLELAGFNNRDMTGVEHVFGSRTSLDAELAVGSAAETAVTAGPLVDSPFLGDWFVLLGIISIAAGVRTWRHDREQEPMGLSLRC